MQESITLYHNPRCSKSRTALEWLQQHQTAAELTIVEYLENPPDYETVQAILDELQLQANEVIRKGEARFKELDLKSATNKQLIEAIVANPILLERPIVRYQQTAAIGRPLTNIIELFD